VETLGADFREPVCGLLPDCRRFLKVCGEKRV
jgi:hypothetical protein